MKSIYTVASAIVLSAGVYSYGVYIGRTTESAKYEEALSEAASAYMYKQEEQRKYYESVIIDRNDKVSGIESTLRQRENEIRKLKELSDDSCVNALIPDSFK